jgi:hypothetical protein
LLVAQALRDDDRTLETVRLVLNAIRAGGVDANCPSDTWLAFSTKEVLYLGPDPVPLLVAVKRVTAASVLNIGELARRARQVLETAETRDDEWQRNARGDEPAAVAAIQTRNERRRRGSKARPLAAGLPVPTEPLAANELPKRQRAKRSRAQESTAPSPAASPQSTRSASAAAPATRMEDASGPQFSSTVETTEAHGAADFITPAESATMGSGVKRHGAKRPPNPSKASAWGDSW